MVDFALDGQILDGDWFVETGASEEEGVVVGFVGGKIRVVWNQKVRKGDRDKEGHTFDEC